MGQNGQRRKPVKIGQADAYRRPVNLRVLPCNRKEDRCVAKGAEVVRIVRVLPQVVRIHDDELSKSLLESGIKLVALAGLERLLQTRPADYVHDNRIRCS